MTAKQASRPLAAVAEVAVPATPPATRGEVVLEVKDLEVGEC